MATEALHQKLVESGISAEVAAARPYVPYTTDDREAVQNAFKRWPPHLRKFWMRVAGMEDGLIMYRHRVPLPQAKRISPRVRPDNPVVLDARFPGDEAKYLIAPNEWVTLTYTHDHATADYYQGDGGETRLMMHIRKEHDGNLVEGPHTHTLEKKSAVNGHGKRLDLHPMASELLPKAGRAFFVLEGEIKADSILSKVQEAVFSVPSVTLWDAPELEEFAECHLRQKLIVLVVDSDADMSTKSVMWHARKAQLWFLRRGFQAIVALPPAPYDEEGEPLKIGVDDFLVAKGDLLDLIVHDVREPTSLVAQMLEEFARQESWRKDTFANRWAMLHDLSLLAREDGDIAMYDDAKGAWVPPAINALAKALERGWNSVFNDLTALIHTDSFLAVEGQSALREVKRVNHSWVNRDGSTSPKINLVTGEIEHHLERGPWWSEEARLTLVPELRPRLRRLTLREWLRASNRPLFPQT